MDRSFEAAMQRRQIQRFLASPLGGQFTVTMRWDERPVVVEEPSLGTESEFGK